MTTEREVWAEHAPNWRTLDQPQHEVWLNFLRALFAARDDDHKQPQDVQKET